MTSSPFLIFRVAMAPSSLSGMGRTSNKLQNVKVWSGSTSRVDERSQRALVGLIEVD